MKEKPLKYSLIFVYNQLAVCLPKPKGCEDLAFLKMYRVIFAYFHLVTLSHEQLAAAGWPKRQKIQSCVSSQLYVFITYIDSKKKALGYNHMFFT